MTHAVLRCGAAAVLVALILASANTVDAQTSTYYYINYARGDLCYFLTPLTSFRFPKKMTASVAEGKFNFFRND